MPVEAVVASAFVGWVVLQYVVDLGPLYRSMQVRESGNLDASDELDRHTAVCSPAWLPTDILDVCEHALVRDPGSSSLLLSDGVAAVRWAEQTSSNTTSPHPKALVASVDLQYQGGLGVEMEACFAYWSKSLGAADWRPSPIRGKS